MARPKKQTVDYFPHYCNHGKTMFILESKYGNDGYAFWFKLLEMLGSSNGHYLELKEDIDWEYLIAKTRLGKEKCIEILNLLASLEAIDKELWEKENIVWSDNFIENIKDVYRIRVTNIPQKPKVSNIENPQNEEFSCRKSPENGVSYVENPQSKVNKSKVNKSKVNNNTIAQTSNEIESELTPDTPPPDENKTKKKVENPKITFNFETKSWENITPEDIKLWQEAYPACDIEFELNKMRAWLLAAGRKGKKSRWRLFITNWLSRQQDRGGSRSFIRTEAGKINRGVANEVCKTYKKG